MVNQYPIQEEPSLQVKETILKLRKNCWPKLRKNCWLIFEIFDLPLKVNLLVLSQVPITSQKFKAQAKGKISDWRCYAIESTKPNQ